MSEKMIESLDQSSLECIEALSMTLCVVEKIITERNNNKRSIIRMSAVAREIKDLIKVVSACSY